MFLTEKYFELESAMLTGYSVFTTFTAEKNNEEYLVKAFELHIQRLQHNVKVLFGKKNIPDRGEIVKKILHFLSKNSKKSKNSVKKQLVRVAIYPKNFSIARPSEISDIEILVTGRAYIENKTPLRLELHEMIRPLAHLKTSALFPSLQTRAAAQKNGFNDALFFYENNITEGPAWNIVFTKGNCVYFPDPSQKTFLEGFTQKLLQQELTKNYINNTDDTITVKIKNITVSDVLNNTFDSAFILSSGVDVVPVSEINNVKFRIKSSNLSDVSENKFIDLMSIYDNITPEVIM